jgi:hypothetical protein
MSQCGLATTGYMQVYVYADRLHDDQSGSVTVGPWGPHAADHSRRCRGSDDRRPACVHWQRITLLACIKGNTSTRVSFQHVPIRKSSSKSPSSEE